MSRIYTLDGERFKIVAKALSTELRINIFKELLKNTLSVQKIAEIFNLPPSTAMVNINKLEEARLIRTELIPGSRGSQKICSALYDRFIVDFIIHKPDSATNPIYINIPIGNYVDCEIHPTCGIVNENGVMGYLDDPRSFYEPEAVNAQLLWLRHGYVEYWVPNKIPFDSEVRNIEISMEICSEAPLYKLDWPSDITLWINDKEIGTWMSPGDFGGTRGFLTPAWWDIDATQYGLLKKWGITSSASYVDGNSDAVNKGGLNIFGRKFGNYPQDIIVRIDAMPKLAHK